MHPSAGTWINSPGQPAYHYQHQPNNEQGGTDNVGIRMSGSRVPN